MIRIELRRPLMAFHAKRIVENEFGTVSSLEQMEAALEGNWEVRPIDL